MPAEPVVLVPRDDGTESCGLGTPLTPVAASGALTNMGPLVTLLSARFEDLLTLPVSVGVDEVQRITIGGNPPTNKTYTLAFEGSEPTVPLKPSASPLQVQDALTALSTIGDGNVEVTQGVVGTYTATFGSDLGNQPLPLMTADASALGGTVVVTEVTAGVVPSGGITATSDTDSMGQLLLKLTDTTGASWVYKVIPAVRLEQTEVVFLGRLVSGLRNDLPPPARSAGPMEVKVPGWGRVGGPGVVAGAKLTVYEKGQPRTGTVQDDGTFAWDEQEKARSRGGSKT